MPTGTPFCILKTNTFYLPLHKNLPTIQIFYGDALILHQQDWIYLALKSDFLFFYTEVDLHNIIINIHVNSIFYPSLSKEYNCFYLKNPGLNLDFDFWT